MLKLAQSLVQNPEVLSLLVELGLAALLLAFPTAAGGIMAARRLSKAALTQGRQAALNEVAPLLNEIPVPNPEIKQLAVKLGQEAAAHALERFEAAQAKERA